MRELVWFPQLDVYDTCRRFVLLLQLCEGHQLTKERLFISDFYLVSPALLYHTKMTQAVRERFRASKIPRDEFISYPPPPVLFEKMSGVQSEAFHNLVGRGLVDIDRLRDGHVMASELGLGFQVGKASTELEARTLQFLSGPFLTLGESVGGLRSITGLRRTGL